jgi:hypothetical protein
MLVEFLRIIPTSHNVGFLKFIFLSVAQNFHKEKIYCFKNNICYFSECCSTKVKIVFSSFLSLLIGELEN